MAKFRFYVVDPMDGEVKGTDDPETARQLADSEYFVVDTEKDTYLIPDQEEDVPIELL